jgi:carotenoid cleavage dioxygenase-like enzyme
MHSFGLTQSFALLPHQSFFFDYNKVIKGGKPLVEAMVDNPAASSFDLKILPLDGSDVYTVTIDQGEPFYYFHVINSYEVEASDAVVLDLSCLSINMLPYFTLEMERTKEIRDDSTFGTVVVKRYTVYFRGPNAGKWTVETLSDPRRSTDFPNFNKAFQGQPSCFFYAIQWFHDYETYADMAILKKDSCTGKELYWHQDNFFPSEPTFVAAKSGGGEDDGILLFTAVHGSTKSSYLVVCDAKTMQTIEMIPVPGIVTFTTHGEWYPKK